MSALQLGMDSTVSFHRGGGGCGNSLCPIYEIFQRGSFRGRERQILSKLFENGETKSMGEGREERKGKENRRN